MDYRIALRSAENSLASRLKRSVVLGRRLRCCEGLAVAGRNDCTCADKTQQARPARLAQHDAYGNITAVACVENCKPVSLVVAATVCGDKNKPSTCKREKRTDDVFTPVVKVDSKAVTGGLFWSPCYSLTVSASGGDCRPQDYQPIGCGNILA